VVKKFMDVEILSAVYFFVTNLQAPLLALAAGGFLYVALADLLPELHKQRKPADSLTQFALLFLGLSVLWAAKLIGHD
jgi:zinc transporter ZupT